jgi:hypothetical protein
MSSKLIDEYTCKSLKTNCDFDWSGREDLNLRPLVPNLRTGPKLFYFNGSQWYLSRTVLLSPFISVGRCQSFSYRSPQLEPLPLLFNIDGLTDRSVSKRGSPPALPGDPKSLTDTEVCRRIVVRCARTACARRVCKLTAQHVLCGAGVFDFGSRSGPFEGPATPKAPGSAGGYLPFYFPFLPAQV